MICSKCKTKILLSHRPGIFLSIALGAVAATLIAWFVADSPYDMFIGGTLGFVALVACGGVFTAMVDASAWVYSRLKRKGVECETCHHINSIRPWSI